ncbi:MAG: hypothetical protein WBI82_07025 [Sphaerochaeta sp.]
MPPFPSQGAMYLTLLSQHSLGKGPMVMLLLLSLRWGITPRRTEYLPSIEVATCHWKVSIL